MSEKIRIRLLTQQGIHPAGSEHDVLEVVLHGGNYDCDKQYVIADQTYVPSDKAEVVS